MALPFRQEISLTGQRRDDAVAHTLLLSEKYAWLLCFELADNTHYYISQ